LQGPVKGGDGGAGWNVLADRFTVSVVKIICFSPLGRRMCFTLEQHAAIVMGYISERYANRSLRFEHMCMSVKYQQSDLQMGR